MSRFRTFAAGVAVAVLFAVGSGLSAQQPAAGGRWITAWGTSQQGLGQNGITNATVRMIARVTIPGDAVRVRLDNGYGKTPLTVGKAYVGQRNIAAAVVAGSNRPLMFNGAASVTIAPGASAMSDPVSLKVAAGQDLAVSLYIPGENIQPSQHNGAGTTSYLTANGAGDAAADESRTPFTTMTTSMFWLKGIDVRSTTSTGAIVTFGDSITDGSCATLDANNRWGDWLAVRLQLEAAGRGTPGVHKSVVNEGIGGNTVTRSIQPPPDSMPGLDRLERDVLRPQRRDARCALHGHQRHSPRGERGSGNREHGGHRPAHQGTRRQGDRRHDHPAPQRGAPGHQHGVERRQDRDAQADQRVDSHESAVRRGHRLRRSRPRRRRPESDHRRLQLRQHPPKPARLRGNG